MSCNWATKREVISCMVLSGPLMCSTTTDLFWRSPLFRAPHTLKKGKTLVLKYRILIRGQTHCQLNIEYWSQ